MMGPRQEAQGALFYEFHWKIMCRWITFCGPSTGLSIWVACAAILPLSTARQEGPQSIPS